MTHIIIKHQGLLLVKKILARTLPLIYKFISEWIARLAFHNVRFGFFVGKRYSRHLKNCNIYQLLGKLLSIFFIYSSPSQIDNSNSQQKNFSKINKCCSSALSMAIATRVMMQITIFHECMVWLGSVVGVTQNVAKLEK